MQRTEDSPLPLVDTRISPQKVQVRERQLWKNLRDGTKKERPGISLTRLETWATPGVPDVMACDEAGRFHLVELKHTGTAIVELRPHQVAFLTAHRRASVWLLVRRLHTHENRETSELFLYRGGQALDVRMNGLHVEPALYWTYPFDWAELWGLISPLESHNVPPEPHGAA